MPTPGSRRSAAKEVPYTPAGKSDQQSTQQNVKRPSEPLRFFPAGRGRQTPRPSSALPTCPRLPFRTSVKWAGRRVSGEASTFRHSSCNLSTQRPAHQPQPPATTTNICHPRPLALSIRPQKPPRPHAFVATRTAAAHTPASVKREEQRAFRKKIIEKQ